MATLPPDRNRLTPEERRRLTEQQARGTGWTDWFIWWWWLWLIMILFVIWFGGWGWGGYGGWWSWGGPRTAVIQRQAPAIVVNVPALLTSHDKASLLGNRVVLKNVEVQGVAGQAIWVGPDAQHELLVVPQSAATAKLAGKYKPGQKVNVQGVLEKPPTAEAAQTDWNLPPDQARQASSDGIYLAANQIS